MEKARTSVSAILFATANLFAARETAIVQFWQVARHAASTCWFKASDSRDRSGAGRGLYIVILGSAPLRRVPSKRSRRVCRNRDGAFAGISAWASGRWFRTLIFKIYCFNEKRMIPNFRRLKFFTLELINALVWWLQDKEMICILRKWSRKKVVWIILSHDGISSISKWLQITRITNWITILITNQNHTLKSKP